MITLRAVGMTTALCGSIAEIANLSQHRVLGLDRSLDSSTFIYLDGAEVLWLTRRQGDQRD